MKISIDYLHIKNFKSIDDLRINLNEQSLIVSGKNGVGKSTLSDAYFWLLSNANSNHKTTFNILKMDSKGVVYDDLPASVEARLLVESDSGLTGIEIGKTYKQKWVKRRGNAQPVFAGHTTEYYWDKIQITQKEYQSRLSEIIDDKYFRCLSDAKFFCGHTKPDYRRKVLMSIAGKISDEDIINSDPDLKDLNAILNGRSIKDAQTLLKTRKNKVDTVISEIPTRIDEARRTMPDSANSDIDKVNSEIKELEEKITSKSNQIYSLENNAESLDRINKIAALNKKINMLKDKQFEKSDVLLKEKLDKKLKTKLALNDNIDSKSKLETKLKDLEREAVLNTKNRKKYLSQWKKELSKKFEKKSVCYACGKLLDEEEIITQESAFNLDKTAKLKDIDRKGEAAYNEFQIINQAKKDTIRLIKEHEEDIKDGINLIGVLEDEMQNLRNSMAYNETVETDKLRDEIEDLESVKINESEVIDCKHELSKLKAEKREKEKILSKFDNIEKSTQRVEQLKKDLQRHAEEFESIEKSLNLIDLFKIRKAEYIENNVSKNFKITSWKLFEKQINDGLRSICEPTHNGIPYSSDLNTGSKINVGLDCIKTLSEHYDIYCPIWIDNAESITDFTYTGHQCIKLIASKDAEKLEIRSE